MLGFLTNFMYLKHLFAKIDLLKTKQKNKWDFYILKTITRNVSVFIRTYESIKHIHFKKYALTDFWITKLLVKMDNFKFKNTAIKSFSLYIPIIPTITPEINFCSKLFLCKFKNCIYK